LHHAALAAGIIATALLQGPAVDLMGYLFGDVYAVTTGDLYWVAGGGLAVLAALAWLWPDLLRLAVHRELAEAEGVEAARVRFAFTLLLAFTVSIAMKIVGALLIIAFLIVPVVAARPFAATPERMAVLAAAFAAAGVGAGLWLSSSYDAPGGPSIVLSMAAMAALALAVAPRRRTQ
jgi:zinc transport system permease protein